MFGMMCVGQRKEKTITGEYTHRIPARWGQGRGDHPEAIILTPFAALERDCAGRDAPRSGEGA